MLDNRKLQLLITAVFLVAAIAIFGISNFGIKSDHSCCKITKTGSTGIALAQYPQSEPENVDCNNIKTTCSRKTGCVCKLHCSSDGRRLPQLSKAECPSFCCERSCFCHDIGCP